MIISFSAESLSRIHCICSLWLYPTSLHYGWPTWSPHSDVAKIQVSKILRFVCRYWRFGGKYPFRKACKCSTFERLRSQKPPQKYLQLLIAIKHVFSYTIGVSIGNYINSRQALCIGIVVRARMKPVKVNVRSLCHYEWSYYLLICADPTGNAASSSVL